MEQQIPGNKESTPVSLESTLMLIATSLAVFLTSFMSAGLNVAIPFIGNEFHADAVLLSWVINAFILVTSVCVLPFGRLADILGMKKIFVWGMILFTIISGVTFFSNSITMLIILRSLQGIGCAMIFATGMALTSATNPGNRRGRALGINISSVFAGFTAGPFLGGILTEHLGWRSMFVVIIPLLLVAIFITLGKIKGEWSYSRGEKFDITGSLVLGLSLVVLIIGFSLIPDIPGIILVVFGVLGLFWFYKMQTRNLSPILNINAFKSNKIFLLYNLASLIILWATFAITYLLSLYLQYIKALPPDQAGLVLLSQPIMLVVCAPLTGRLSDKFEPRTIATLGILLMLIGLALFSFISADYSLVHIIIILAVIGLGMALFFAPNNSSIMGSVIPKYYGVASATNGVMRSIGQSLSISITTVVISVIIGRVVITPEHYPGLVTSTRISFAIFSVLCLAGIITTLAAGKIKKS
jgi:EmrB/QacA subfamily drug resistance transporter